MSAVPGVVIPCLVPACSNTMELLTGSIPTKHRPPVKVSSCATVMSLAGISCARRALSSLAVRHDRLFNTAVDLLLRAIGGADKPIEARDLASNRHTRRIPQAPHFGTHQVDRQDQAMQEGETRQHCERTPRQRDTRRGSPGTPATPAACCEAPQAPWPLDAGRSPGLCRSPYRSNRSARSIRSQRWWRSSLPHGG